MDEKTDFSEVLIGMYFPGSLSLHCKNLIFLQNSLDSENGKNKQTKRQDFYSHKFFPWEG